MSEIRSSFCQLSGTSGEQDAFRGTVTFVDMMKSESKRLFLVAFAANWQRVQGKAGGRARGIRCRKPPGDLQGDAERPLA